MNKILLAGLAGVVAATAATAEVSQCGNGGFYVGGGVGAVFGKLTVKMDQSAAAKSATDVAAKTVAALKKLNDASATAQAAVTAAQADLGKKVDAEAAALADVVKLVGAINAAGGDAPTAIYPAIAGTAPTAGSLQAVANVANANTAGTNFVKMVKKIVELYPAIKDQDNYKGKALNAITKDELTALLKPALTAIYADAALAAKFTADNLSVNNDGAAFAANTANGGGNIAINIKALYTPKAGDTAAKGALVDALTSYTALTTATTTYTTAAKAYTDAFAKVQTAMLAADKSATAPTTEVNKALFGNDGKTVPTFDGFSKTLAEKAAANATLEATELGLSDKGRAHKKATGFMGEIFCGYDHRFGDMMVGAELSGFFVGGGKAKIKDKKAAKGSDALTGRMKYGFQIMGRAGYLVAPQFEIYGTIGGMGVSFQADTTHLGVIKDQTKPYYAAAVAAAAIDGNTTVETANAAWNAKNKKYKKFKFVPVFGAGVRYEITPEMFTKLEYNFVPKKQIVSQEKANAALSYQAHILKVGFGVRFGS